MTDDPDDTDLRKRFGALAAEDARAAPPFAIARTGRRGWTGARLATAATVLLAVAGAAAYGWWAGRTRPVPYPVDLATVTWEGPTDFLLQTPGAAMLRELPAIGWQSGAGAPAPGLTDDTLRRNRT
jgi:hypothetical protein